MAKQGKKQKKVRESFSIFDEEIAGQSFEFDDPIIDAPVNVRLKMDPSFAGSGRNLLAPKDPSESKSVISSSSSGSEKIDDIHFETQTSSDAQSETQLHSEASVVESSPQNTSEPQTLGITVTNEFKRIASDVTISPLETTEIEPNLEKTSRKLRENLEKAERNLEKTQRKVRENLEITSRKLRENLEIDQNTDINSQLPRSESSPEINLEKTQRKLRENLEIDPNVDIRSYLLESESIPEANLEKTSRKVRENLEIDHSADMSSHLMGSESSPETNLEKTSRKVREKLEIDQPADIGSHLLGSESSPESSSEKSPPESDEKLEIQHLSGYEKFFGRIEILPESNLEKTSRKLREKLEKRYRKPRENLENPDPNLEIETSKLRDKPRDEPRENLEKTQRSNVQIKFSTLVGLQRKITLYIYFETVRAQDTMTGAITSLHLAEITQTTVLNAQNAIKELVKKDILRRAEFKNGRGGWTRYELNKFIFNEINSLDITGKLRENLEITSRKPGDKPRDKPRDEVSSSSSININKTTTEKPSELSKSELPDEWKEVDYSCLASIGFKEVHLRQIFESNKATPDLVQESIYELDHDLKSGLPHGMRNPLLVFLKQLRAKGEPYTAVVPGYVSDQLRYERKRLDEMKRRDKELVEIKHEQNILENRPTQIQKEKQFDTWLATTSPEERRHYAPHAPTDGSSMQRGMLRSYWESNVLPKLLESKENHSQESVRNQIEKALFENTLNN